MMTDRPQGACLLCRPPAEGKPWKLAPASYLACYSCQDRLVDWLLEIPQRYDKLSATPGCSGEGRRGPGFGSQPPANLHIVALTDLRTTQVSPGGVQSVPGILSSWAQLVTEERDLHPKPPHTVSSLCGLLRAQLDWIAKRDFVDEFANELRELRSQLRTATGEPRPAVVGTCTEFIDDTSTDRCGAPIRGSEPPLYCPKCGSVYTAQRILTMQHRNQQEAS